MSIRGAGHQVLRNPLRVNVGGHFGMVRVKFRDLSNESFTFNLKLSPGKERLRYCHPASRLPL